MHEPSELEARRDYLSDTLSRGELDLDPVRQFGRWYADARAANIVDASAMSLATVDRDAAVHARIVLLKRFDEEGFCWYTNQQSDKGRELAENPRAALLFYWRELERQVRIEGPVERLDPEEAEDYFQSRPEGSRFGAVASAQSQPVESRAVLEKRVAELREQYPDGRVPRPPHWGGYRLRPQRFEFWQGRGDRLHDRFVYLPAESDGVASWALQRLQP